MMKYLKIPGISAVSPPTRPQFDSLQPIAIPVITKNDMIIEFNIKSF